MDVLNAMTEVMETLDGHPYGLQIATALINKCDHIVLTADNWRDVQRLQSMFSRVSVKVKQKRKFLFFKRKSYTIKCYYL